MTAVLMGVGVICAGVAVAGMVELWAIVSAEECGDYRPSIRRPAWTLERVSVALAIVLASCLASGIAGLIAAMVAAGVAS